MNVKSRKIHLHARRASGKNAVLDVPELQIYLAPSHFDILPRPPSPQGYPRTLFFSSTSTPQSIHSPRPPFNIMLPPKTYLLHKPCLSQSPNFAFPNCAKLFIPCSLKSILFNCVTSCVGALLTRWTIIVGSVSRIIPSSTISSMARETRS